MVTYPQSVEKCSKLWITTLTNNFIKFVKLKFLPSVSKGFGSYMEFFPTGLIERNHQSAIWKHHRMTLDKWTKYFSLVTDISSINKNSKYFLYFVCSLCISSSLNFFLLNLPLQYISNVNAKFLVEPSFTIY